MNQLLHIVAAICLFAEPLPSNAGAESNLPVKLTGIASVGDIRLALFEVPVGQSRPVFIKPILSEGERVADLEVLRIEAEAGRVHVRYKGAETFYLVNESAPQTGKRRLQLRSADSKQVLDAYQQLSGRTVLMEPGLPGGKVTVDTTAPTRQEAAAAIAVAFGELGIALEPKAEKFAFAVHSNRLDLLALIPEPPADSSKANQKIREARGDDVIPAGMIKFQNADILQFLEIYQELAGVKVLNRNDAGPNKITFKSQTELTRAQAVWAMEAIFRLADLKLDRKDDKSVTLIPSADAGRTPRDAR